ncbi:hypothetical protein JHW43_009646 [Diplocarpon mali]|nr:hypothetical protein JHW43_009646 [Diplocarpon mali]
MTGEARTSLRFATRAPRQRRRGGRPAHAAHHLRPTWLDVSGRAGAGGELETRATATATATATDGRLSSLDRGRARHPGSAMRRRGDSGRSWLPTRTRVSSDREPRGRRRAESRSCGSWAGRQRDGSTNRSTRQQLTCATAAERRRAAGRDGGHAGCRSPCEESSRINKTNKHSIARDPDSPLVCAQNRFGFGSCLPTKNRSFRKYPSRNPA